jgi:Tfp pilus assembly protein PilF
MPVESMEEFLMALGQRIIATFFMSLSPISLHTDRALWNPCASMSLTSNAIIAQGNRNAIQGVITNTAGQPLNRIRVELQDEVEMTIRQAYTDGTGRYSFRTLSSGTFIIKANGDGSYLTRSARINLYGSGGGSGAHLEQVDLVLKSREEAKGPSASANAGTAFAQETPEKARKIYLRAIKQLDNSKQIELGIDSLKEAIQVFPDYFLALERLGIEYVKREQNEDANQILARALAVNPNSAASLYALGVAQFKLRLWTQSAQSLQRSLTLAPNSANAAYSNFYLGLAYLRTQRPGEAERHLKKSIELGGNTVPSDCHMYLAQIYSDNKKYKEAADELELFLKLTPNALDADNIKTIIKNLREKARVNPSSLH